MVAAKHKDLHRGTVADLYACVLWVGVPSAQIVTGGAVQLFPPADHASFVDPDTTWRTSCTSRMYVACCGRIATKLTSTCVAMCVCVCVCVCDCVCVAVCGCVSAGVRRAGCASGSCW